MNTPLYRTAMILDLLKPKPTPISRARRVGSNNDGGYVLIDDCKKTDFLISMGIADNVDFEKELVPELSGGHLYDYSISQLPEEIKGSIFFQEKIGGQGNTTILNCLGKLGQHTDLLMKMDIEGSEYEAIDLLGHNHLSKFRQIIVEFHFLENIVDDVFFDKCLRVLKKLNNTHFVLNSHPNNFGDIFLIENLLLPSIMEVTFLRRDSYLIDDTHASQCEATLRKLNAPCNPTHPEIYLQQFIGLDQLNLNSQEIGLISRGRFELYVSDYNRLLSEFNLLKG
jgi:hypothetical protein